MTSKKPLISVIVTTFNRKELLKETIDSILNQTFNDFELIVVDNNSDYEFLTHMNKFNDKRIRVYQNSNDGIIAINRNFGIKKARGDYIAFCDDDDLWAPQKLEKQIATIEDSENGMVCTMNKRFGETNIFSKSYGIGPLPYRQKTSRNDLLKNNCIALSSVLLKKSILYDLNSFDERRSFISIEDHDLWIRISAVTKIQYIPEVLLFYRVHKCNLRPFIVSNTSYNGISELYKKHGVITINNQNKITKPIPIISFLRNVIVLIIELLFYKHNTIQSYK
jgi:glycosyltransferase involved in cell wall biosynthesis